MCNGPFLHGTEIMKYFPGHGMFKGKVTRLPSQKNKYYKVEYSDNDSEELSLEELRQYSNFYVYLKNVESEDIEEGNYFSTTTNVPSNASAASNSTNDNEFEIENDNDNGDENKEEKTKKREKKVVLSLLIETLEDLKESAGKSLRDGDCKILTMQLKDNMPFFKDTWEGFNL